MNPDLLRRIGEALYGPDHWIPQLARALGVSDRSMRRWAAGSTMPEGAINELAVLAKARHSALTHLLDEI